MSVSLSPEQVWKVLESELFAVLGMVTARSEARTVGIMYVVRNRRFYIPTGRDTWKARHIMANPHVSLTVPIAKRVPFMPWMKIPAATITFAGTARVIPANEVAPELLHAVFRQMADEADMVADSVVLEVTPIGEFITYGVGVPLLKMRDPAQARGRAPVG